MSVLVAYDGTPLTEKALNYAMKYAKLFGERLYVISVIDSDVFDNKAELVKVKAYMDRVEKTAASNGVDIHTAIESGPAGETIMLAAGRFKSTTIIVGRTDKSVVDRAVLGSVSNYILNHAQCTVVVIH